MAINSPCSNSGIECDTIQLIEPDSTLPVGIAGGTADPSLNERGEVVLATGQSEVAVVFQTPKSGLYRFEYLYVDAFGIVNPGTINPVPITQTAYGFTVDLAGAPPVEGYILRWRVVVVTIGDAVAIDSPENLRVMLNWQVGTPPIPGQGVQDILFANPRSNITYGFTELRVENLTDDPRFQTPVAIQVVEKRIDGFKIAYNPVPQTANYFLVARTP